MFLIQKNMLKILVFSLMPSIISAETPNKAFPTKDNTPIAFKAASSCIVSSVTGAIIASYGLRSSFYSRFTSANKVSIQTAQWLGICVGRFGRAILATEGFRKLYSYYLSHRTNTKL